MSALLRGALLALLALCAALVLVSSEGTWLQRQKREWIIAPRQLKENHDYTGLESIARIRSDKENFTRIIYSLTGPGVDQPPVGVFGVNPETGYVKIYSILDREEIAFYELKGMARYVDGTRAEKDIDLRITVVDENDCVPVIKAQQVSSVEEASSAGTVVMRVIATDADQEGTRHSQIHYSIVEESNVGGMFYINSQTGEVMVRQNSLDREVKDTYTLTIRATDLDGQVGGNTGTGQIKIKLLDINDNIPTLEKEFYEGSIQENTINMEVMRVQAVDLDVIHTDNWLAVYNIVSGNEGGYFSIKTDPETNEGIIMINKALDYEEIKSLNLEVSVNNKAKYDFRNTMVPATGSKPYPVKINVVNQKEGPRFQPTVKVVTLSEDQTSISLNKIITTYSAIDSDTLQTATNVRYAKLRDDDNWLIIDEKTADIRLNKLPDRESKFLINGTYYAEIIVISTDMPSKTATGTIAIQVEDFNDHCPQITATTHTMCLEDNVIYVTAVDRDEFPNSAPFDFTVIPGSSQGKWSVEHLNETTAILRDQADLWPGIYQVAVEVKDQQGKACGEVPIMDVTVCTCVENTKACRSRSTKTAGFGGLGVLLLLLGLLLLLLVPLLLLFCLCGGVGGDFKAIPFDTKQQLIAYHTEGQGEDKEMPLLQAPVEVDSATVNMRDVNSFGAKGYIAGLAEMGGAATADMALGGHNASTLTAENMHLYNQYNYSGGQMQSQYMDGGMNTGAEHYFSQYRTGVFDGMALSNQFLGDYYSTKSNHASQQSQHKDALMVYDYEGQESLAGSVGCCSLLENDDDLSFLNDLGPKFKTLAEICHGSSLVTESAAASVSIPPPRPASPIMMPASTHTNVHTHSERVRDHVSSINTSNMTSEVSTVVQEGRVAERVQGSSALSSVQVQDNIVVPSQTVLMQQPAMYVAATPMYVVESKPQMVLVAGGAQQAVGQAGLSQGFVQVGGLQGSQGLMQVGGLQGSQGLVQVGGLQGSQGFVQVGGLQGSQGLMQVGGLQGSQGVVLIDRQQGGAGSGQAAQGTVSRSRQVLVVENGSAGAVQSAHLASARQGLEVGGHAVQMKSFSVASTGSNEDFEATPRLHGSQRVLVQHKKVSVTERSAESSSRA